LHAACVTTADRSPEITCDLGSSTNWTLDDTVTVTVPVIAANTTANNSTLVNSATITAAVGNQTVNSTATATVRVTTSTAPTLKVTKSGPAGTVKPGESFTFNVTAGVARDGPVNPLILVDELQSTELKFEAPLPAGRLFGRRYCELSLMLWLQS
jgi:hypothetical protein